MPVMGWSKNKLGRPPLQIAEALTTILKDMQPAAIAEITATKPGFVNFRLNRAQVGRTIIERVLEAGPDFGLSESGVGTKVIVEHTNINSNKAAHVGHLRNSCIGDTVVRMLRSQGYQVEADNYIDDSGVHVAVGKVYENKETESGKEALELRRAALRAIEHGEEPASGPDYSLRASDISRQIVQAHLNTMARLNISYDLLTWESVLLHAGLWRKTFEMLRDRNLLEKPESGPAAGCWILPFGEGDTQTSEGDHSSDKILVRSDGTATYTAKDIAYQLWKFGLADEIGVDFSFVPWCIQRDGHKLWTMRMPNDDTPPNEEANPRRFGHAKRVMNVIDVRQSYLQQVVYESLRRLGFVEQADNSQHLGYEVVTLSARTAENLGVDTSDKREFYPMSGRKGIEIKADDLINAATTRMLEVRRQDGKPEIPQETAAALAASAIRYFMIRFSLQQIITLDIDEALRPNGDTGVYLQYAYARANSIQRRLQDAGHELPEHLEQLPAQLEQSEWELLRHIDAYPRQLADASEKTAPSMLASYAYELAAHFSDFYEHTPPIVKETDEVVKTFRVLLVQATAQTMSNVLRILGFKPQERI